MPRPGPSESYDQKSLIGCVLLIGLVVLFSGATTILYDTLDPDCFWHLRVGQQLRQEGIHPLRDAISFASNTEVWTPYSWLAEIGMSWLWDLGGVRAAVLVTSLLTAGVIGVIALTC